ncbi:MAG: hypothetical protein AB7I18_03065 [Candidatus Berkiella sp.]
MSGLGPKKEAAVALWDVAGQLHQLAYGAKEVAQEVADTAVEQLTEVAQGKNTLGTTESAATIVKAAEVVKQVVQPFSPLVQDMCPLMNNVTNTSFVAPIIETAKNASTAMCVAKPVAEAAQTAGIASYALGGLGALFGGYGLYRLYNARKQAQQVMQPAAAAVAVESPELLQAFPQLAANPLVKAFLQGLTAEQAQALKALEEISKGALANIVAMSPEQQLLALQTAVAPVATMDPTAVLTEVFANGLKGIAGTEGVASKKPATAVAAAPQPTLAQTIMVSAEAKQILAIVEAKPTAKAVLNTMSKEGLEGLARNSNAKTLQAVQTMNSATLETFLTRTEERYAPKVEEKAKTTVKPN